MKNILAAVIFLFVVTGAFSASFPVSMASTNGRSFGQLLVNSHIKATNTATTNTLAGKFQQGQGTQADGASSAAFGINSRAGSSGALGAGIGNSTLGQASFVVGRSNVIFSGGANSIVSGNQNSAGDLNMFVSGFNNIGAGSNSLIAGFGIGADSGTHNSVLLGQDIQVQTGAINNFVWNGDPDNSLQILDTRTNAFTVQAPGGIWLNGISFPQASGGVGATTNYIAAGTNSTAITNGNLVTLSSQPRIHVAAGTNIVTVTNGALVTVNAVVESPQVTTAYTNSSLITINNTGQATPYPSSITGSSITDEITSVYVSINGFNHNNPEDIALVLISPSGHQVKLMEGSGSVSLPGGVGGYADLVFSDSAPGYVSATTIASGSYRPTVRASVGTPSAPATGPFYTNLSVLYGTDPNGSWGLYAYDGVSLDGGYITNWSLTINSGAADYARLSVPTNHFLGDAGWDGEVSFESGEMGSIETGTLDVTGTLTANEASATNLTVQSVTTLWTNGFLYATATGVVGPTNNGGGLTNISGPAIIWPTNQAALTVDMSKPWAGLSTNANIAISGFPGIDARGVNVQVATRVYTNSAGSSAVKTIVMPAGCIDLSNTGLTLYNTNQGFLTVTIYPGFGTNFSWLGK